MHTIVFILRNLKEQCCCTMHIFSEFFEKLKMASVTAHFRPKLPLELTLSNVSSIRKPRLSIQLFSYSEPRRSTIVLWCTSFQNAGKVQNGRLMALFRPTSIWNRHLAMCPSSMSQNRAYNHIYTQEHKEVLLWHDACLFGFREKIKMVEFHKKKSQVARSGMPYCRCLLPHTFPI